jgi:hypothetical protein
MLYAIEDENGLWFWHNQDNTNYFTDDFSFATLFQTYYEADLWKHRHKIEGVVVEAEYRVPDYVKTEEDFLDWTMNN